jgi:hypothetical protein
MTSSVSLRSDAVCIDKLLERREGFLPFMTHFKDDDILPVWHRLNEVHRTTALQGYKVYGDATMARVFTYSGVQRLHERTLIHRTLDS